MKKPALPGVPGPNDDRARFDGALKDLIEIITGRSHSYINRLDPATATLADCVAKINEILEILQ